MPGPVRRDERAQMMLLTAFVLVIAFVALSGMVSRLSQLPEATRQSAERPIYLEAEALAEGVLAAMEDINVIMQPQPDGENMAEYIPAMDGAMKHLQTLESARGYRLRLADPPAVNPWCDDTSGEAIMNVQFSLADPETLISFTISWTVRDPTTDGNNAYIDTAADAAVTTCTDPTP